jgi:hypothetical protein
MADGFLAEVERLLADPRGLSRTARQALGYRELATHVEDGVALDEALDLAVRRTRRFARRQASWFRRDPRIRWLDAADDPGPLLGALADELAAADAAVDAVTDGVTGAVTDGVVAPSPEAGAGGGESGTHATGRRAD